MHPDATPAQAAQLPPLPFIQSIPHAGFGVPPQVADLLALSARDIYNDCDLWADQHYDFAHTDLAAIEGDGSAGGRGALAIVTTEIARVLVDVNREPDDFDNPDGVIKAQSSYGVLNYRRALTRAEMVALRDAWYTPYHRRLEQALAAHAGQARLLLDCHNMAQIGPDTYKYAGKPRPLICLANLGDAQGEPKPHGPRVTCAPEFLRAAGAHAAALFADLELLEPHAPVPVVALNWPFAGGHIIKRYAVGGRHSAGSTPTATAPAAIMIEVNRGLFVGNQTAATPVAPINAARVAAVRARLYRWACAIGDLLAADAADSERSQA